ncbi:P-loop containing nucleoside triphosphate hydrolase protein [Halenospora varia]|nr:P-loop containing nucleoside triphosphate hydrolase protein [Halenospora varia]
MATGQPPWLYIVRGSCALFVTIINLGLPHISKYYYTPPTIRPNRLHYFSLLLIFLFLLYTGDLAVFTVESLRRNERPSTTAVSCEASLILSIAIEHEWFISQEKKPAWEAHAISWALLCVFEILTVIYLCLHQTAPSPLYILGISLAVTKGLIWIALLLLFYQGYLGGYKSLSDSNSTECEYDVDDEDSTTDKANNSDELGIRREAREEVRELGGWWPFLKRFHIFLEYTWPWGQPLLQLRAILAIIIVLVESILDYLGPTQYAIFFDALAMGPEGVIWRPFLIVILIETLNSRMFLVTVRNLLWIDVSLYRSERLKLAAQTRILSLDAHFHSLVPATDLIKAVDYAGGVDKLFDTLYFGLVPNLVCLILAFTGLFHRYGPLMMLILTCKAVFYILLEKRSVMVLTPEWDKYITVKDTQERRRQDGVRGWATVFNHNQVEYEINCFKLEVRSWRQQIRRYWLLSYSFGFLQSWTLSLGHFAAEILIICEIRAGRLSIGDLVAFSGLWGLLLSSIRYFSTIVNDKLEDILGATRLRRIMESEPRVQGGDKDLKYIRGNVEFQNVTFSYPKSDNKILDNMSLKIEGGSTVAIVGSSGVGKSTLMQLIKRQNDATGGIISIDGQDVTTLESTSIHKLVGMMPQKPFFFDKTVMENIMYAKQDATAEEVYDASRKAGLHESIMKRHGNYQSVVRANGENFSGGELQRLAFARLVLQDPMIVLIDEGTSALDAQTEAFIKQSIKSEFVDKTVIIIAHRLSSIKHADRILVLGKGGEILEDGKHADLVKNGDGHYASLWRMHMGDGPLIDLD